MVQLALFCPKFGSKTTQWLLAANAPSDAATTASLILRPRGFVAAGREPSGK